MHFHFLSVLLPQSVGSLSKTIYKPCYVYSWPRIWLSRRKSTNLTQVCVKLCSNNALSVTSDGGEIRLQQKAACKHAVRGLFTLPTHLCVQQCGLPQRRHRLSACMFSPVRHVTPSRSAAYASTTVSSQGKW